MKIYASVSVECQLRTFHDLNLGTDKIFPKHYIQFYICGSIWDYTLHRQSDKQGTGY